MKSVKKIFRIMLNGYSNIYRIGILRVILQALKQEPKLLYHKADLHNYQSVMQNLKYK